MVLNITSGQLSGFVSIEGGAAAGETATLVGGITLIKNMPSNENFRGVSKSAGLMGGYFGGISVEKFWGGAKYFQDASDLPDGSFAGIGGAVPGLTLYGSLGYSYEALRVDKAGSHWLSYRPSLSEILSDFGEVIQHDVLKIP